MAILGPDHYLVYFSPPEHPGLYVLRRHPQRDPATVRTGFVCKASTLAEVRRYIPDGYANTGVPEAGGPIVEIWVHQ